ncbi:Clp1/GlmU family protein [Sulfurisphaera ohwakuensis]|uniref:Clp1/GlmU family protein n=1 Tax=Sulfurisphaera ohwakuensis TaxID=69656 RepID=UPI0036F2DC4E
MLINKDIDIVVRGPCKIRVKQGTIDIQGIEINDEIEIKDNKTYTLTTLRESEIDTECQIISYFPSLNWRKIGERISGKVIVIGDENSGKTYFSNLVANLNNSQIIDADVGQSSIFIPTFISLSNIKKTLNAKEKGYSELQFFGHKSPSINPKLHIALVSKLIQNNNIVIDTDGWITGIYAYRHKLELIYLTEPEYIVVFENNIKLTFPKALENKILYVKAFPLPDKRDRTQRRKYRQELFKEYFSKATTIQIESDKLFGTPLADSLFISWGTPLQLVYELPCEGYYVPNIKGLLVGLTKKGKIVGAGIIQDINKNYVLIKTPEKDFDGVLLGYISLNENYEDTEVKIRKCPESSHLKE